MTDGAPKQISAESGLTTQHGCAGLDGSAPFSPSNCSGDIYVDEPKPYPLEMRRRGGAQRYTYWSHLWTEAGNEEALHAFAARLGLKREWFQNKPGFPHYDITEGKVRRAHRIGAIRLTLRHWLEWKRRSHQNDRTEP